MTSLRFSSVALGPLLLLTGCFDPPTSAETNDTDAMCMPGDTQECTCDDGEMGIQTCDDTGAFGTCDCSSATTTDTTGVDESSTGDTASTGEPPECTGDADCSDMAGECQVATCSGGVCMVDNATAGTACGDATEDGCNAADACDGDGNCLDNLVADGITCDTCAEGVCTCNAGACETCTTFAAVNAFDTPRAVDGWELTGSWGLYVQAPQSLEGPGVPFGNQVLGTDGNRVSPYPGAEVETSYVRTPPLTLPVNVTFDSWHVDEGGITNPMINPPTGHDNKRISISTDGGASWTPVIDCATAPMPAPPFCTPRLDQRAPDDWDAISFPVPAPLVGSTAIIEFAYESVDDCCGGEQGWYLDNLNIATECDCVGDEACEPFGGECGAAVCGASGACEMMPVAADSPCGDPTANGCTGADRCNGQGQCVPADSPAFVTECLDCPSGQCSVCAGGTCNDCSTMQNDFIGPLAINGWSVEALEGTTDPGWGIYALVPRNQVHDPANPTMSQLSTAPVLGTDGNRLAPYPGGHAESSRITSPVDIIPPVITFDSWNQDEGGIGGSMYDNKMVEILLPPGPITLVNCGDDDPAAPSQPFCVAVNGPRAMDDWDSISIPTGPLAGQMGQLRFTYDTQDSCCEFERGWYIDNLNFAQYCM